MKPSDYFDFPPRERWYRHHDLVREDALMLYRCSICGWTVSRIAVTQAPLVDFNAGCPGFQAMLIGGPHDGEIVALTDRPANRLSFNYMDFPMIDRYPMAPPRITMVSYVMRERDIEAPWLIAYEYDGTPIPPGDYDAEVVQREIN